MTALIYTADGLLGEYFHARAWPESQAAGVSLLQRADGAADRRPGLMTLVGGMGLLAASCVGKKSGASA